MSDTKPDFKEEPQQPLTAIPEDWLKPGTVVPVTPQNVAHLLRFARELLANSVSREEFDAVSERLSNDLMRIEVLERERDRRIAELTVERDDAQAKAARAGIAAGKLHADLYGMQDGALLRDLQRELADLRPRYETVMARLTAAVKVMDALDALTDPEGLIPGLIEGPERQELESALADARLVP